MGDEMRVERDAEWLRAFTEVPGPFVSVYLDDSRDTADAENRIDIESRDIRELLMRAGATHAAIEKVADAVGHGDPAVGRQGRAIIVAGDRLLVDEHFVPPPPAPTVRVSDYPFVLPLLERSRRPPPYLYVAVDRRGATIVVHQDDTVRTESIEGDGYPIHKPATAGWKGYGDFEGTTEEAVRTNMRTVADRVIVLADQVRPDVVFISGETRARTDLASVFPDRIQRSVALLHAGSHGVRAAEWEVADDIDRKLNLLWRDNIAARVETSRVRSTQVLVVPFRGSQTSAPH